MGFMTWLGISSCAATPAPCVSGVAVDSHVFNPTPQEARAKRIANKKRKAQKAARRRNRR